MISQVPKRRYRCSLKVQPHTPTSVSLQVKVKPSKESYTCKLLQEILFRAEEEKHNIQQLLDDAGSCCIQMSRNYDIYRA